MRLPTPLTALLLLLPFLALADEFDAPVSSVAKNARTTTIYAWPLSSASPTPLAQVSYTPRSSTGDYVPLEKFSGEAGELVRIGVDDGKAWSVVRGDLLGRGKVTLRVDNAGAVWGVEVSDEGNATPRVEVVRSQPGAAPHLNKPVVLNPDGKVPVPEVEKTFLQKYWWIILAGMVLLVGGGGGGSE